MTAHITNRRLAGDSHAVITVEGDGHRYCREPCLRCPWRVDAVGEFPAAAFQHSANTGVDGGSVTGASILEAMHTFGCHASGAMRPATCAGYILGGSDAIGWRISVTTCKFDPSLVTTKVPLFGSYYEMAVANGVPADDPELLKCRPWRLRP